MDGRTRYNKIKRLLEPLVGETLHIDKIKRRIMIDIGTSDVCLEETCRLMIKLDMIKEIKHCVFKVLTNEAKI